MHGVYGHVSPAMRADLKAALQARWEDSLRDRARLCPRSTVPTLDALLAADRQAPVKIDWLPKSDIGGVADGCQDHA